MACSSCDSSSSSGEYLFIQLILAIIAAVLVWAFTHSLAGALLAGVAVIVLHTVSGGGGGSSLDGFLPSSPLMTKKNPRPSSQYVITRGGGNVAAAAAVAAAQPNVSPSAILSGVGYSETLEEAMVNSFATPESFFGMDW